MINMTHLSILNQTPTTRVHDQSSSSHHCWTICTFDTTPGWKAPGFTLRLHQRQNSRLCFMQFKSVISQRGFFFLCQLILTQWSGLSRRCTTYSVGVSRSTSHGPTYMLTGASNGRNASNVTMSKQQYTCATVTYMWEWWIHWIFSDVPVAMMNTPWALNRALCVKCVCLYVREFTGQIPLHCKVIWHLRQFSQAIKLSGLTKQAPLQFKRHC